MLLMRKIYYYDEQCKDEQNLIFLVLIFYPLKLSFKHSRQVAEK